MQGLSKSQRLLIIIGISLSFFVAEIAGKPHSCKVATSPLADFAVHRHSRLLHSLNRADCRRLSLCMPLLSLVGRFCWTAAEANLLLSEITNSGT